MRSVPVVMVNEVREECGADGGMLISAGASPFAQGGLNEAFGLAIGFGRVGRSARMAHAEAV